MQIRWLILALILVAFWLVFVVRNANAHGGVLFTVFELRQEESSAAPNRITVDAGRVDQLAARFKRTRL